jgi:leucyl aminopeptidase
VANGRHVVLVGKGLTYDSGGLAIKPGDVVHAMMKNDMSGGGAVFAAMLALRDLQVPTRVTAHIMCTDNMPSGTAMKMGDVITHRDGTTVEVLNTDAEGRLVMADAIVMGVEAEPDAIIDIATLTGACMRALGTDIAGVMGTSQPLVDQIRAAGEATDEPVWQLPMGANYRAELDSDVADLKNLGGANAGASTAAEFLAHFAGDVPWAHIDIAGVAATAQPKGWKTRGMSGFGARLLLEALESFTPPN